MSRPEVAARSPAVDLLRGGRRSTVRAVVLAVLVVAAIVTAHTMLDTEAQTARVRALVKDLGAAAPPAFVALTAVSIPLCVPVVLFLVSGSLAFGPMQGALYALGGVTLGACAAFLLGRYVLRGLGKRLQESRVSLIRAIASQRGPLPVIGVRFAVPFAPGIDYAIGAAGISLADYLVGTFLGVIPRVFAVAFFFDVLTRSDWVAVARSEPALLVLFLFPLIRVGGVLILVRLVARQAAAQRRPAVPTA